MQVILIRHGESISNVEKYFSCDKFDEGLSQKGKLQAEVTSSYIAQNHFVSTIYCSPLLRTQETAQPISNKLAIPIVTKRALIEPHFGELETRNPTPEMWDELWAIIGDWHLRKRNSRFPKGESYGEFDDRVTSFLQSLNGQGTVIVVTHGAIIQNLLMRQLNLDAFPDVPNCSITIGTIDNQTPLQISFSTIASVDHL